MSMNTFILQHILDYERLYENGQENTIKYIGEKAFESRGKSTLSFILCSLACIL